MAKVYYIGGSPCSGKSTLAEIISKNYGFYYFKVDDHLDEYMKKAAAIKKPVCTEIAAMTADQIWMRDPSVQNDEEFECYRELFEFVLADINKIPDSDQVITEGAAFLPELMKQYGIDAKHYMTIVPTPEFQVVHYRQRPWVPYVLSECSNQEQAFINWMDRDILFAKEVRRQSEALGYTVLLNDGQESVDTMLKKVCRQFELPMKG